MSRKFGVLIAAHGNLAEAALESLEMLTGHQENIETVGIFPGMGRGEMRAAIEKKLELLAGCQGILIAADLVGGTPANVAAELAARPPEGKGLPELYLAAGVNMAFLCELTSMEDLNDAVMDELTEAGRFGLQNLGEKARSLGGSGIDGGKQYIPLDVNDL